jgi:energy-coupling factor transport system substrate-specific component
MGIRHKAIKDAALIAVCSAILFVQQYALSFLPNVQATILLLVVYTKMLGFKKTSIIIIIHVIVYNMLAPFGTVMPLHFISMAFGYLVIPILLTTVFKKVNKPITLAIFGFFHGFLYGWSFIPITVFVMDIPFLEYFLMDLPYEFIMAISSFLTILWLYEPIVKLFKYQLDQYYHTNCQDTVIHQ